MTQPVSISCAMVDICTICRKILRGDVLKLMVYYHRFCNTCIQNWTKEVNEGRRRNKGYCPTCRRSYNISNVVRFASRITSTKPPANESKKQRNKWERKKKQNARRLRRRMTKATRDATKAALGLEDDVTWGGGGRKRIRPVMSRQPFSVMDHVAENTYQEPASLQYVPIRVCYL